MTLLAAQGSGAGWENIILIIALIAIFYFFMIRPQTKRQNEIKKFREGLKPGDNVVTAGGIYGKIKKVEDTTFVVEVTSGVSLTIDKNSVYPSALDAGNDNQAQNQ
ncbi:MAG: preprotein translocase subunit YajC [Duncaniella sp.]|nr:preprotein translocase subunit YajC [Duncaniella sp.]